MSIPEKTQNPAGGPGSAEKHDITGNELIMPDSSAGGNSNPPIEPKKSLRSEEITAQVSARVAEEEAAHGTGAPGKEEGPAFSLLAWQSDVAFSGEPETRKYLVDGIFPMGQPSLLAAAGGTGKSFALLGLALDVAGESIICPKHFGGEVACHGTVVYISAEDDKIEIHNRIKASGGPCPRFFALPGPSLEGGCPTFFEFDPLDRKPKATEAWDDFVQQCAEQQDIVCIIIDPLQPFCTLDLNAPENAQFVCSKLAALAAKTGAAVILSHHFRKEHITGSNSAREAIRGTAGLVDGMRAVVCLWPMEKENAETACEKDLGVPYVPEAIVYCQVVKSNGKADRQLHALYRTDSGVLTDVTDRVSQEPEGQEEELKEAIVKLVADSARQGQALCRTGDKGVYKSRHLLPEQFKDETKKHLGELTQELLNNRRLVACQVRKIKGYLDVPGGPFALGQGEFRDGAFEPEPGKTGNKVVTERAEQVPLPVPGSVSETVSKPFTIPVPTVPTGTVNSGTVDHQE